MLFLKEDKRGKKTQQEHAERMCCNPDCQHGDPDGESTEHVSERWEEAGQARHGLDQEDSVAMQGKFDLIL